MKGIWSICVSCCGVVWYSIPGTQRRVGGKGWRYPTLNRLLSQDWLTPLVCGRSNESLAPTQLVVVVTAKVRGVVRCGECCKGTTHTGNKEATALSSRFCWAYLPRRRYTFSHVWSGYRSLRISTRVLLVKLDGNPNSFSARVSTEYQSSTWLNGSVKSFVIIFEYLSYLFDP
mgnify:CR=1 FL=1